MAGYTYTTYKLALQTMMASQPPDVDFDNILPSIIDYAEQRCYRELDLVQTVQTDATTTLVVAQRAVTIPSSFVVVNNVNVLTPAGSNGQTGERVQLTPMSLDVMNVFYPGNTTTGVPKVFAMVTQWSMILGPSPDATYSLEVIGTYRPDPLSATNTTTFLSERLPDLFMAASMVFASGYMRNFGAQVNDPQMSSSWETQYQTLFKSAMSEEVRKSFWASSWSSLPNSTEAQPTRG